MNILNINSGNTLLKSYNSSSLKKIQTNGINNKNIDISSKELHVISKGKHLAMENLDATYNSSINKKLQESLEHKLSQLSEIKGMIENKDNKKETSLDEEETLLSEGQLTLEDIDKKISETHIELKATEKLAKEFSQQSEIIDDKISMYKKTYGNDMYKIAEKEVILKKVYDLRNNPLVKELKNTFNEVIELESQLKDTLNKDKSEDKKEKF
ncbi:hypothetical protein [Terrisporobacter hibernicus]|uniref:Uncharacterized protein n=1 Tax=Terrisporobacter hibernicus TaxID=2813371 RepID=A0AAX2ZDD1_9FIRM|nr:hypothetical protein [Terrisporobacter hibernicus]UEL47252.1 hypothetical protein JW646_16710 [Terrisporobacter hibernicus]